MKDNFDLKKFLKESKAIENLNPTFRRINEAIEPNLFVGWGVIPKYLGGESSNWKVIGRKFNLRGKAEGVGPVASMTFEFKNNKDFKIGYLAIFVQLVDPNSVAARDNGMKTEIGYRVSDDIPKEKAKEYISEIQPEIVNLMRKYVSKDLKSLGKAHIGGGYEDKVTEEDKKSFMNQLSKLSSNKNYKLMENESPKTNTLKEKIREMIINELSEADDTLNIGVDDEGEMQSVSPKNDPNEAFNESFTTESEKLHEESGLAAAAIEDIKKNGKNSEWIKNLPAGMAAKLLKKVEDEKNLKEAKKDEEGEDQEEEYVGDDERYEFEKGKEAGEEEGKSGIEDIAADLDGTESDLMGNLMNALKIAKGMDNEKLEVQIGNTLKFFVSTYIDKEENER